jgi:hypothetical protein
MQRRASPLSDSESIGDEVREFTMPRGRLSAMELELENFGQDELRTIRQQLKSIRFRTISLLTSHLGQQFYIKLARSFRSHSANERSR